MTTLLPLALAALLAAQAPDAKTPRKPHPLAPSLPQLTDEEEAQLDRIIDRFILFDTGQLQGQDGAKAKLDFDKLGPEATFALIRGLNKAALIEHSCPVVVISKKLSRILGSSKDAELLEFARENIGAGVGRTRHGGLLQDLRVACLLRKRSIPANAVAGAVVKPGAKPARVMSVSELAESAASERGLRLREILVELEQRKGDEVLAVLSAAAVTAEADIQQLARDLLVRNLARQTPDVLKGKLKDERAEVRRAGIVVVATQQPRLAGELIDLLADGEANVRTAARQGLVRLSRGVDFGPAPNAAKAEQEVAIKKWREWWIRQGIR